MDTLLQEVVVHLIDRMDRVPMDPLPMRLLDHEMQRVPEVTIEEAEEVQLQPGPMIEAVPGMVLDIGVVITLTPGMARDFAIRTSKTEGKRK
ncbi:uncharacterized protein LAJ45_03995 [Morchella importuna]|uniref:uncharacterized protein n=1 Tax=Morchella importuna TaxID=1174673 RepID=UPI001E8D3D49|nr:uncharacterized protein LAJ45_03995 [Morchella importuna]KAH8152002.1 hypothetical protein LAJ45_03995 [Morchella importuna]